MPVKNSKVILRPQAQQDLDLLKKHSIKAFEEIFTKIEWLKEFPNMGPAMDGAYEGYRQLLSGNFRIIYEIVSSERIEIAYIRHCSRQLGLRIL